MEPVAPYGLARPRGIHGLRPSGSPSPETPDDQRLERLSRELKRRTRVATLFPNEASLLRLVSALGAEIGKEWETGRVYLRPEPDAPCPPVGPDSVDLAPPERRSRRGRRSA